VAVDPNAARIVLRAPIRFDAQDGTPIHAPLVLATIGAVQTWLVLDTGADVHLVTREVAEAAGLALSSLETGTDHAGAQIDSWLAGDVPLRLDDAQPGPTPLMLRDVVVIPAPAAFLERGIGGGLSPQRLHESAYAVIDEIAEELLLVDGPPEAVRDLLLGRREAPPVLLLSRRETDDVPIVEASVEPHRAVPFLVNTGGRHTELGPAAAPGLRGGALERIGGGVSGSDVMGAAGGAQVLRLGDRRVALPSVMLRPGLDDPPAMLGQDVLRGTVVAVAPARSRPVLWQVATLD
jgi:hypothetical protein